MDNHKLVTIFIFGFFLNMKKMQFLFFFMKNMLGKILGFGRMQQIFFFFLKMFWIFFLFFFEISRRKLGILIPDLYFTCKYTTRYYTKLVEKYSRKIKNVFKEVLSFFKKYNNNI